MNTKMYYIKHMLIYYHKNDIHVYTLMINIFMD